MRILTCVVVLAATLTVARAQDLPPCAVGLHVDLAGGTNEPGVITDADEAQGSYRVHYDNSTMEDWMGSPLLRNSCVGAPAGAKSVEFFTGAWDENHQRGEPDLVVNSDHTYEWLVAIDPAKIIKGTWHDATPDQLGTSGRPGIVLETALYDKDWYVKSEGDVDGSDREQILAEDDSLDYYYFFRSRGPSTN